MTDPIFVYDSRDPATRGREDTPWWGEVLAWMRANRMDPNQTCRIEIFDLDGAWFARTVEYTQALRGGKLCDPVAWEPVAHRSTYVLDGPPPALPGGEG